VNGKGYMKKLAIASIVILVMSCNNGANDGNAATDTTTMPRDTNLNRDTSNHINRADGVRMMDSNSKKQDSAR
jgi:hypothetical protein